MANVIKSSTTIQPNTIAIYPFVIGVNYGGYGSTSSTYYYNGKTPNVNGYVVYKDNGISSPPFYIMRNDTNLIDFVNQIGGGVSNIGDALNYMRNSGIYKCVNFDYPNIVTSGITLNLDAGYVASYPRVYTTWSDMSGNYNTGNLINGPSYNTDAGGSLVFDGVDDYVSISTITLGNGNISWTINAWIKTTTTVNGLGQGSVISNSSGGPVYSMLGVNGGKIVYWTYQNSAWAQKLGVTTINDDNWHMLTWVNYNNYTMDMYVDGVLDTSVANSTSGNNNPLDMIGGSWAARYSGRISNLLIYQNKSLTPQEVLQNYYAGLQRLILTNFLRLYLDGNNTDKQVLTPTIANDISTFNLPATLYNGVSLSRDGQRSFSFDGTDDYISIPYSFPLSFGSRQTIIMWLKPGTGALSQRRNPYNQAYGGQGTITHETDGTFTYYFGTNGGDGSPYVGRSSGFSVGENEMAFVAFTRDQPTNVFKSYKNGVLVNTGDAGGFSSTTNGSLPVQIGSGYTGYPFIGIIGQVRLYARELSPTEISTIYNATKTRYGL
jgi:hypothetical protein